LGDEERVDMIEVKTKYDLDTHKEFLRFLFFRGRFYRYKQIAFTIMGILLLLLWFLFYFIIPEGFVALIFMWIGIILILWAHMVPALLSWQNAREASKIKQSGLEIVFGEDRISITTAGESAEDTSALPYEKVFGAYETKNDFYIFITRAHAFIVSKKDFVKGVPGDLRTLLKTKMKKNFVLCK